MSGSVRTIAVILALVVAPSILLPVSRVIAEVTPEAAFSDAWDRTDFPVLQGEASRTWIWGPRPVSDLMSEPGPGATGGGQPVKYFDKARMEIPDPEDDPNAPAYVAAGRLTLDLISGRILNESGQSLELAPSTAAVAGDLDDASVLTYAQLSALVDEPPFERGETLTTRVAPDGTAEDDPALAVHGAAASELAAGTNHRVASTFWEFMSASGIVWNGVDFVEEALFPDPYFATGPPVTEAYWLNVRVAGVEQDVLLQCFERRCLTYAPGNPEGWQVESNNIGLHYYEWRYGQDEDGGPGPLDDLPVAVFTTSSGVAHAMSLEVAASDPTRQCGLMHRTELPDDTGMLFVWDFDHQGSFWNCNTFVLLTLAWIDADGVILGFIDMEAQTPGQPQQTTTYPPPGPYRYAIEANQGWFEDQDIAVGDRVDLEAALERGDTGDAELCRQLGYECR